MKILGISAFYHDSAAALIVDGKLSAAAQEERFTRKKQDASFPTKAIEFCLQQEGIGISDLDCVVFYDKPLLKFERLLESYYAFSPRGLLSFAKAIPTWLKEKLFLKKVIKDELLNIDPDAEIPKLLFPEHHLSHAASAFYPSPFEEAAILTIDGVGEWATTTISHGKGKDITIKKQMNYPHSWGLLYSAFTYFLGFKVNSGEYKLMGLAPYGNPESPQTQRFIQLIKENIIDLKPDGSIWLNMEYFEFGYGLKMCKDKKWEELFGFPKRAGEGELTQDHMNLAFAIQKVTEEGVLKLAAEAKRITGCKKLVMAGGVALNCVANGKIVKSKTFEDVWIQPAAGDAGGALGAALAAWHVYYEKDREVSKHTDSMSGSYLGPEFGDFEIVKMARLNGATFAKIEDFHELCEETSNYLSDGKVVGWFQGRMEWGPRALGNRSILANPSKADTQRKLNLKIKYRESFRPFAPSVLLEDAEEYFDGGYASPYMLLVDDVMEKRREPVPDNYFDLPMREKLYFTRSDLPAITHLDFSARVQTVDKNTNEKYWKLISSVKAKTGYGMVVNTSFNVRGEPIVCTPEDAYRCFIRTEMDVLVVGNYVFRKWEQNLPTNENLSDWREEYPLD